MSGAYEGFLHFAAWLYNPFFENSIFFLDYWSVVHFLNGMGLMALVAAFAPRRKWFWFFGILFLYEVLEILFVVIALSIFRPETLTDQVTDLVTGAVGGIVAFRFISWAPKGQTAAWLKMAIVAIIASFALAFLWAGSNPGEFSSGGTATPVFAGVSFHVWLLAGIILLMAYFVITLKGVRFFKALLFCWAGWIAFLVAMVLIEHEWFERTTGGQGGYYVCYPVILLVLCRIIERLIAKAQGTRLIRK